MPRLNSPAELEDLRARVLARRGPGTTRVAVCGATGCHSLESQAVAKAFEEHVARRGLGETVRVKQIGCPGFCEMGPVVVIHPERICYVRVTPADVEEIVARTLVEKQVVDRLVYRSDTGEPAVHEPEIPFFKHQTRLLTADASDIDPGDIEDYLAVGGYAALVKVLRSMTPEQVLDEVKRSGLRGRSGGGFQAGRKWEAARAAPGDVKSLICNCHEGDPGAFVDRRLMEGNPHVVLEGMLIGAFAIGATEGHIFVGDEFPLTVANAWRAIRQAEEHGLLGDDVLGTGMKFTVTVDIDAGNYVCGESTALMASMEGRIAEPRMKYDHATERGLWARPTVLNNLQTWANVPLIITRGGEWHSSIGTARSKGTRVFSLAGKVRNTGLVEVPMGTTLRQIVFDIGGGVRPGKRFKAVQVGGPLGGFAPERLLDTKVDYDDLTQAGFSMGPTLIVLDDDTCIVDMVRYSLAFLAWESCGKCTPCRDGLRQMLKIVTNLTSGRGMEGDLELLEELSWVQKEAALCALGQGASSPVLSTLELFRDEFEAHVRERRCPGRFCDMGSAAVESEVSLHGLG
jgi:NADH-quinone oxidoreductase subunit F